MTERERDLIAKPEEELMGCDIHGPYIEYRAYEADSRNGEVWYGVAVMDGVRNYRLFGLMAGVRNRAAAVVETDKGRPQHMDNLAARHAAEDRGDCHSASWLTLAEMRAVAEAYRLPTPDLDDPEPEVVDRSGWGSEADYCVALMAEVERWTGKPTRAVFCFDN